MSEVFTPEILRERGFEPQGENDKFWAKDGMLFELKNGSLRQITKLEEPGKGATAPEGRRSTENGGQEVFKQMDKWDEEQFLAEVRGEVLEQMVYVSRDGNTKALSWAGVKTVALKMAAKGHPLSIEEQPMVSEKEKGYVAMAVAKNLTTGEQRWGVSEQPYKMTVHVVDENGKWIKGEDGKWLTEIVDDDFARIKVVSKAQRNAMRALLPETEVAAMIKKWLEKHGKKGRGK